MYQLKLTSTGNDVKTLPGSYKCGYWMINTSYPEAKCSNASCSAPIPIGTLCIAHATSKTEKFLFGCEACAAMHGGFKGSATGAWAIIVDPDNLVAFRPEYQYMEFGNKSNWKIIPETIKCNVNCVRKGIEINCKNSPIPAGTLAFYWGDDSWWCQSCCAAMGTVTMFEGFDGVPRVRPNKVELISFGYKYSNAEFAPHEFVFDVRKVIRNPWKVSSLRNLTGKDEAVQKFLSACPQTKLMIDNVFLYAGAGFEKISVGCYGGKHRSVAIVEMAAERLKAAGFNVIVTHKDLNHAESV